MPGPRRSRLESGTTAPPAVRACMATGEVHISTIAPGPNVRSARRANARYRCANPLRRLGAPSLGSVSTAEMNPPL